MVQRPEGYGRPKILFAVSTRRLRDCLSLALKRAAFGDDPILVTRRGFPTAAIISIDDLNLLESMKIRRDRARNRELPEDPALIGRARAERLKEEMFFEYPVLWDEERRWQK